MYGPSAVTNILIYSELLSYLIFLKNTFMKTIQNYNLTLDNNTNVALISTSCWDCRRQRIRKYHTEAEEGEGERESGMAFIRSLMSLWNTKKQ
jgi:hypothetical protein